MERAHDILFWERKPPTSLPDLQALQLILESSQTGVLVLNTKNEALFSTAAFSKICANNYFKTNFNSLFKYSTAQGNPDSILIKSDDNVSIEIQSSFIHWNGEKAALFLVREIHEAPSAKRDEALHIAMHLIESFQLPVLFFRNDVLEAANLRAIEQLNIDSNEFHRTHFAHLFDKISSEISANAVENLLSAVTSKAIARGDTKRKPISLVSRNVVLDGTSFKMVQMLNETAAVEVNTAATATTAHDVMLMASHDLREPVRTVLNYAQLTLDKLKNGKYKQAFEYAELSAATAHRMDKLLNDIKVMVSIDEKPLEQSNTNLQTALSNAIAEIEKAHDKNSFEIHVQKLPEVSGNEKLLTQLFKQLLDNAVKFRKGEKALIDIASEQEDGNLIICIRDNGIGIPRKYKHKIFEPFQRLNRVDEYPGSGLGLTIAKKIAEKHHGSISVDSMNGTGAAFYISLPQ